MFEGARIPSVDEKQKASLDHQLKGLARAASAQPPIAHQPCANGVSHGEHNLKTCDVFLLQVVSIAFGEAQKCGLQRVWIPLSEG